jgi:ferrous-iron efflux pump FieF
VSGGHHHHAHAAHGDLTRSAALASVAMALVLVGLKVWAAWATGSTAMLGSLADTALDLFASVITLFGVRYAAMPADDEHRFGHGKAEALAAMVQLMLISVSAIWIGWRSVERWMGGAVTAEAEYGIGVSLVAILLTLGLLAWQRRVIARTGSVAIATDSLHYQSDVALNVAVIVALVLDGMLGLRGADPLFGIGIAAWLLWGAWRSTSHVLDQLLDREWPVERKRTLLDALADFPEAKTIHLLKTRTSGAQEFVQFHLWFPADTSIAVAHEVMVLMEERIEALFPGVEVMIHAEPEDDALEEVGYQPSEMAGD